MKIAKYTGFAKYTTVISKYATQIFHDENCYKTSPSFLKLNTNFYSNKALFCNGFLHNLHESQFFFFNCKNYLKK